MKNAKGLMPEYTSSALVRIFLVAMLFFASREGLMSQTNQDQQDDSNRSPAADGQARGRDDRRGQEQPLGICIASAIGGDSDRKSRQWRAASASTLTRGTCAGQLPTWKFSGARSPRPGMADHVRVMRYISFTEQLGRTWKCRAVACVYPRLVYGVIPTDL